MTYLLGVNKYTRNDYWASYSLRNKPYYADISANTTWTLRYAFAWLVPNSENEADGVNRDIPGRR